VEKSGGVIGEKDECGDADVELSWRNIGFLMQESDYGIGY